jgi:hypothetical protein
MNPPTFGFLERLGVSPLLSTTPVVEHTRSQITTVDASSLLGTSMTQVTQTQPLASTSPTADESGNILASLIPHMHTLSALLVRPIDHMANSQVIQITTFTQATQPTSPTLLMRSSPLPLIGGQSSMGGQPLA